VKAGVPPNNEVDKARDDQGPADLAAYLVVGLTPAGSVTHATVLAIIWPDHGVRDHLGALRDQGTRCAAG